MAIDISSALSSIQPPPAAPSATAQLPVANTQSSQTTPQNRPEPPPAADRITLTGAPALNPVTLDYSSAIQAAARPTSSTAPTSATTPSEPSLESTPAPAATEQYENSRTDFERSSSGEEQPIVDSYV